MDDRQRFQSIEAEFRQALQHTIDGPFGMVSGVWDDIFSQRENFPTYDTFAESLKSGASVAVGIGFNLGKHQDPDAYHDQYRTWVERIGDHFTPDDLARWPESSVGSPTIVEFRGYRSSVLYIKNFAQALFFERLVEKHARRQRGLRVLEIGAGYGGVAEILLRKGIAATYTIVDLPENLFLSAQYLPANFPDRSAVVCDRGRPETFKGTDFRFLFPNDITLLEDDFDLVLNASSFGEMPAATAQAYVAWISRHLSDEGLFISHNAVRVRPQTELLQRHSDYGYDAFNFESVHPSLPSGGPLYGQHLVIALSKRHGVLLPPSFWLGLDRISALLNFGLNNELKRVFAFIGVPAMPLSETFLAIIERFYASMSPVEKYDIAAARVGDSDCDLVLEYLQGAAAFVSGDSASVGHFVRYMQHGRSPMAIALAALVVRAGMNASDREAERIFQVALTYVPAYVIKQLETLKLTSVFSRFMTYLIVP